MFNKSQIRQDEWVWAKYVSCADATTDGREYFVEIGGYDGYHLSNSYYFERFKGWDGLCVECNPYMIERFRQNRPNTKLCTKAVYKESGHKLKFNLNDCNSAIDEKGDYEVETISINDLLTSYGAPRDITYISLDIEGTEAQALSTFDFDYWNVFAWTIEHNFEEPNRSQIIELLLKNNYMVKMHEWDIYAYKDFLAPEFHVKGVRVK
jgi:FkbM family methyltransferase